MQQEYKIIKMLLSKADDNSINNVAKFLSNVLYSDDRYCLINILLGTPHIKYYTGDTIYCHFDYYVTDKIENKDFCLNHGYMKVIDDVLYLKCTVNKDCEYKSTIYVDILACDIDGNPIVIDKQRSISRDRILLNK